MTDLNKTSLIELSQFFDQYRQLEQEQAIQFEADFDRLKDGDLPPKYVPLTMLVRPGEFGKVEPRSLLELAASSRVNCEA